MRTIFTHRRETHTTRESWLKSAVARIRDDHRDLFAEHGDVTILDNILISAGFPSKGGANGKTVGQCWATSAADGSAHIFINPIVSNPVEILAIICHEMGHAADDCKHGHKGPFVKMFKGLRLEGKPTCSGYGDRFKAYAWHLLEALGTYPHKALTPDPNAKKQKNRQLKMECPACGYAARAAKKWIEIGLPTCHCGTKMVSEFAG
jgi:hypothetical protein